MNSIRVHSSISGDSPILPYLILSSSGPERVAIDLSPLVVGIASLNLVLSQDALYDVLRGKDLFLCTPEARLVLSPRGEELVIAVLADDPSISAEYRVWLSEVALGWNVLSRSASYPT